MSAIGPIFLVVGLGLVVGCLLAAAHTRRFLASAQQARAEVVGVQQRSGSHPQDRAYYPVLRYRTQQGATQEVVSSVGSNPPRYKEGDTLLVLYNPARPSEVRIHSFTQVWIAPLVLGVLGVLFLLVGAGLTVLRGD